MTSTCRLPCRRSTSCCSCWSLTGAAGGAAAGTLGGRGCWGWSLAATGAPPCGAGAALSTRLPSALMRSCWGKPAGGRRGLLAHRTWRGMRRGECVEDRGPCNAHIITWRPLSSHRSMRPRPLLRDCNSIVRRLLGVIPASKAVTNFWISQPGGCGAPGSRGMISQRIIEMCQRPACTDHLSKTVGSCALPVTSAQATSWHYK